MAKDYFSLLKVPQKLTLDHNLLKKNYFNLIRHKSKDPVVCADSISKPSAKEKELIKKGYETLKDRITRIEHLLEINGLKVANDNRAPGFFAPLAAEVQDLLKKTRKDAKYVSELKKLHHDVLSQFSAVSVDLARLEKAWDAAASNDVDLLKKLKRKTAAFSYIRDMEQDIRAALG